jgi:formylglycine-generating enzyme required for sulfatase activity
MNLAVKTVWLVVFPVMLVFGCSRAVTEVPEDSPKDMVLVSAGTFLMGTNEDIDRDNFYEFGFNKPFFTDAAPGQEIYLDAYYIDKYEVSNKQYFEFVRATNHAVPAHWKGKIVPAGFEKFPVRHVNWIDASEYCKWAGKRLPSEAEWEKAAKGEDSRRYPWGNEFSFTKANVSENAEIPGGAREIGSYETGKSPYGAYDMAGNVWEWTDDWYKAYPDSTYETPKFGETYKVVRGNSGQRIAHFSGEKNREIVERFSSTVFRLPALPQLARNDFGIRCVKSLSKQ